MRRLYFFFIISFLSFSIPPQTFSQDSWQKIKEKGSGNIIIYWETSRPFIYRDNQGNLIGIEHEIMNDFTAYLKDNYDVEVSIKWQKAVSFDRLFTVMEEEYDDGAFAVSALSVTYDRKQRINFGPPYMSDIAVMVSSKDVPIATSTTEFDTIFDSLTAISIKGTTYESDLVKLKKTRALDFEVELIPSSSNILQTINGRKSAFGYIDLPIYLQAFSQNTINSTKRQNLFPIKREGYSIAYPKSSDWVEPINQYFTDPDVEQKIIQIISKYLDYEIYHFIESSYEDNISLLTKEKEIQKRDLLNKSLQIQRDAYLRYGLIIITLLMLVFAVTVYRMYKKRHKVAMLLEEETQKVESQRLDIIRQKDQLEKKSSLMTQFNDEKNNLIKILAHDLRTPINHIQGLANIYKLENRDLSESNAETIDKIIDSSDRLLKMISKILDVDAIEANRVNLLEEQVDIIQILQKVISSFEKEAANKKIKLITEFDNGNAPIIADPLYLTEIFENLISNAIKFSKIEKQVTIKLESSTDKFITHIVDQGPGLSDDDKELLFKKFQRLSAQPTAGEQSTGIGLSIVKKYVELMGGEVWCESEIGQGATFKVSFKKLA